MLFHTLDFVFLLIFTITLYSHFKKKRLYILAVANLIFYGVSGFQYLILFLFVAFISYVLSIEISKSNNRFYLILALGINLVNLMFFKYFGFIIDTITRISNLNFILLSDFTLKIILPIGISFYTFQIIAYLIDVYKKEILPPNHFIEFWVFISFFGQLIAGPIMRGREFLFQIKDIENRRPNKFDIETGLFLIALGLFKKVVIADPVSNYVGQIFSNYSNLNFYTAWIGIMLFAFQIYLDFSSYSEIAVGTGKLLGLNLRLNFITPYLSKSPSEFWKRWHITLSEWIRDYVYIPLGGNKGSYFRIQFNLIVALALSGLWHGANFTFVIWGIYHGILIVIYKTLGKYIKNLNGFVQILLMFILINIGWVFFRVESIPSVMTVFSKMIKINQLPSTAELIGIGTIIMLFLLHYVEFLFRRNLELSLSNWETKFKPFYRAVVYVLLITIFILSIQGQASSFIYFQF